MKHDSDRREAALDWLVRTNDPEFDGRRFHRLARGKPRPMPTPISRSPAARPRCCLCRSSAGATRLQGRAAAPGTDAAGVAVLAALATALVAPRMMPIDYSTGPGEVRIVSLGGRDQLVMNGDTRLQLAAGIGARPARTGPAAARLQNPMAEGSKC